MSFGPSIGDIYVICEKIVKATKRYRDAPREIEAQKQDVASWVSQLQEFRKCDLPLEKDSQAAMLQMLEEFLLVLEEIKERLDKATSSGTLLLGGIKRRVKRATFNPGDLSPLWKRAEHCSSRIHLAFQINQQAEGMARERERLFEAISKYLPNAIPEALDGTGTWVLNSDILQSLQSWESDKGGKLLCHGQPGGGKTTMAKMETNQLLEKYRHSPDVGIACVFVGPDSSDLSTLDDIQRALLRQLCEKQPRVLTSVSELRCYRDMGRPQPKTDEILIRVINEYSRVLLIVDGVDEFGNSMTDSRRLMKHLRIIQSRSKADLNLLLTSAAIPEGLADWPRLEIRAHDDDVVKYIEKKTEGLPPSMLQNGNLPEEITRRIVDISDGMFLAVRFMMEEIANMISFGEVGLMFRDIEEGVACQNTGNDPAVLHSIYNYVMNKIDRRSPRSRARAREVISWLLCVVRPLKSYELCHAFKISKGGKIDVGSLIGDTRGLVACDQRWDTVQLYHRTARSYFEQAWKADLAYRHADITDTLMTCLNTDDGTKGGIYEYAAINWAYHAGEAPSGAPISTFVMEFLRNKPMMFESCEILLRQYYRGRQPTGVSGTHLAAHFGLLPCLNVLASEGSSVDGRDENGETPLLWAARNGQEEAVVWLLEQGVDVDAKNFELKSCLHYAAIHTWERPLRLLLERNANVTADIENMTPVHYAVQSLWIEGLAIFESAGVLLLDTKVRRLNYQQEYLDGRRAYKLISDNPEHLPPVDGPGLTPLHFAAVWSARTSPFPPQPQS